MAKKEKMKKVGKAIWKSNQGNKIPAK
jgi:hypothetical protein